MARAIYELKSKYSVDGVLAPEIEETVFPFLDRFYTSRIGIRTLIGGCLLVPKRVFRAGLDVLGVAAAQHLELRNPRQGYVGIIDLCSSPSQIASAAMCVRESFAWHAWSLSVCVCVRSADARFMCERTFGDAPKVVKPRCAARVGSAATVMASLRVPGGYRGKLGFHAAVRATTLAAHHV
jgi:hypothetical protein